MVAAHLRQQESYDLHRKPDPNLQPGDMVWLLPRTIKTTRPQRNWTSTKLNHSKSWQRLGQAHINRPYHPQWPYTTHSISLSTNLRKTTASPHRSKNSLLLFRQKEKINTNWMKLSTLDCTTTSLNIELSGKVTHQNTIKFGTPRKT